MSFCEIDNESLEAMHDALWEQLGDIETQYKSEVALYGDAWPGAQIELSDMRQRVAEVEAELVRRGLRRKHGVGTIPVSTVDTDDIPF